MAWISLAFMALFWMAGILGQWIHLTFLLYLHWNIPGEGQQMAANYSNELLSLVVTCARNGANNRACTERICHWPTCLNQLSNEELHIFHQTHTACVPNFSQLYPPIFFIRNYYHIFQFSSPRCAALITQGVFYRWIFGAEIGYFCPFSRSCGYL